MKIFITFIISMILILSSLLYLSSFTPAFVVSNDSVSHIIPPAQLVTSELNGSTVVKVYINQQLLSTANSIKVVIQGGNYTDLTVDGYVTSSNQVILSGPFINPLIQFYTTNPQNIKVWIIFTYYGGVGVLSLSI
ncbi:MULTISPECIES: hypothetical protein [Sulfolobaceae]|uniref:hypothetical protein n=1 Tax=Sulfolobaceae TaxID=118883 RepID=UPI00117E5DD4|nr:MULTISPECIES: hypothetical protein [unclassified Sulfolobus]